MKEEKRQNIFTLRIPEIGYEGSVSVKVVKKEKIAELRIINYEGNKDVTQAISIVNTFLKDNGIHAVAIETSKDESAKLMIAHTQGKNAVYLIGDSKNKDALIKYTYKLDMANGQNVFTDTKRKNIENSTGWGYTYTISDKLLIPRRINGGGNSAVIGLDKFYIGKDNHNAVTDGFVGTNINAVHSIALTILHVIGHNAGVGNTHNPSRYPTGIMTNGTGLLDAIQNGASFSDITSMNQQNIVWLAFVRSYFNGSGLPISVFSDYDIKIHTWNSERKWFDHGRMDYFAKFMDLEIK